MTFLLKSTLVLSLRIVEYASGKKEKGSCSKKVLHYFEPSCKAACLYPQQYPPTEINPMKNKNYEIIRRDIGKKNEANLNEDGTENKLSLTRR